MANKRTDHSTPSAKSKSVSGKKATQAQKPARKACG